ncbi:MAG: phosphonoacetaldehyde hydrolase [Streptococcaceae bacterium]|nr:phosphonoacetaldehyde hydrolase [Streptococcaceae bacterium]MCL2681064.1 phosphonoacetaldehyde hydrolase [Streptococcaceae bacterium]
MTIEAVIFDWAGTTVDYGCFAPVQAFVDAFKEKRIDVTLEEVREPMGMLKRTHIETMLNMPRIKALFKDEYGRSWDSNDVDELLATFTDKLMNKLVQETELKPFLLEAIEKLQEKGIAIGATTGYTRQMIKPVAKRAEELGYKPDASFTPDETENMGRPYPYMIFENMKALGIISVKNVIKVGDTVADIQEAKNAGIRAFGVIEGSSLMGLSKEEYESLSEQEQEARKKTVEHKFYEAGADMVINNLSELIEFIN